MAVSIEQLEEVFRPLVQHLADVDLGYVAGALEAVDVAPGTRLLSHGEESDAIFLVVAGKLKVSLEADDAVVELGERTVGEWVGELGVVEPGPASATVEAPEGALLWKLTHAAFARMRKENPCAAACLMEGVAKDVSTRLRTCNRVLFQRGEDGRIVLRPAADAPEGMLGRILHQVKDAFGVGEKGSPDSLPAPGPGAAGMTLDAFLHEHPAFGELPDEDRERLAAACEDRTFVDGTAFIKEGVARDNVYFILDGQVAVSVQRPEEASFVTQRVMGPGEIIGLIALADRGPRSATCTALGDVKVASLLLQGANLLMNTHAPISAAFRYALAAQLARDARQLNDSLLEAARAAK